MRRWLQTIAELTVAVLVHLALLVAVGFNTGTAATRPEEKPARDDRARRVRMVAAGPGRAAASGRRTEEMPGFPVPVAAEDAPEGAAVRLPAVSREQVRNTMDGEQSTRQQAPVPVPIPRPELSQTEPQLARGARGDPEWQLPGQRIKPLQLFPSPVPGPTPGRPATHQRPPSGGSRRDVKVAVRGHEAAPRPTPRQLAQPLAASDSEIPGPAPTSPQDPAPQGEEQVPEEQRPVQAVVPEPQAALAEVAPAAAAQDQAPEVEAPPSANALDDRRHAIATVPASESEPENGPLAARSIEGEQSTAPAQEPSLAPSTSPPVPEDIQPQHTADPLTTSPTAPTPPAEAELEEASPRDVPRLAEEPSPPDPKDLPEVAEAPESDQLGPHVPRPDHSPEDRPATEGIPGGADSQQPVLLAMAPPATQSALEGATARLEPPGDERLDPAQRALASAIELLELAAIEGGEAGARRAAEAAVALAAAEESLRGLEAPEPSRTGAPPQAGAVTDLPAGAGLGNEPGSPMLGGTGRLNALAQGRVDYVASLVGPSIARRAGRDGTGKVHFRVDERGYVRDVSILRSTGDRLMDQEIESTLHLAEPFAATPGWISVVVRFEASR